MVWTHPFFLLDPSQDFLRLMLRFLIPDLELRSAVRRTANTCTEASSTRKQCLWLLPHKVLKDAMEQKLWELCWSRIQKPIVCVQKELYTCYHVFMHVYTSSPIAVNFLVCNVCGLRSSLFTGTASLVYVHLCVDKFHISS